MNENQETLINGCELILKYVEGWGMLKEVEGGWRMLKVEGGWGMLRDVEGGWRRSRRGWRSCWRRSRVLVK